MLPSLFILTKFSVSSSGFFMPVNLLLRLSKVDGLNNSTTPFLYQTTIRFYFKF
jgi:hypothetical protein